MDHFVHDYVKEGYNVCREAFECGGEPGDAGHVGRKDTDNESSCDEVQSGS